jgi:hypothetical protein
MLNDAREASPVRKEVEAVASGELPDVRAMLISSPDVQAVGGIELREGDVLPVG